MAIFVAPGPVSDQTDIGITGNRLVYRAHDMDGKVRDEFVIEK